VYGTMSLSSDLFQGSIALEYADILNAATRKQLAEQTCGSDCSDGHKCTDETCPAERKKKPKKPAKPAPKKKKAFYPVVPGWNEPPALPPTGAAYF
jgi:hypothetical protein